MVNKFALPIVFFLLFGHINKMLVNKNIYVLHIFSFCLCFPVFRKPAFFSTLQFFFLGYIDLSKRRVSPEDIEKCEEKFAKARAVRLLYFIFINLSLFKTCNFCILILSRLTAF